MNGSWQGDMQLTVTCLWNSQQTQKQQWTVLLPCTPTRLSPWGTRERKQNSSVHSQGTRSHRNSWEKRTPEPCSCTACRPTRDRKCTRTLWTAPRVAFWTLQKVRKSVV